MLENIWGIEKKTTSFGFNFSSIPLCHFMWLKFEQPNYLQVMHIVVKLHTINGPKPSHFHKLCGPR